MTGRGARNLGGEGDSEPVITLALPSKEVESLSRDEERRRVDGSDVAPRGFTGASWGHTTEAELDLVLS